LRPNKIVNGIFKVYFKVQVMITCLVQEFVHPKRWTEAICHFSHPHCIGWCIV